MKRYLHKKKKKYGERNSLGLILNTVSFMCIKLVKKN